MKKKKFQTTSGQTFYQIKPLTQMQQLKNFQQINSNLNKLQVNLRTRGIENAFMKMGEEYEYEKVTFKKKLQVRQASNASDEEGTMAQAFTRFDNDENTDQYEELASEGII